jgi:hypothetical protein
VVNEPNTAALPTDVTWPVRLAFVVTLPAVNPVRSCASQTLLSEIVL